MLWGRFSITTISEVLHCDCDSGAFIRSTKLLMVSDMDDGVGVDANRAVFSDVFAIKEEDLVWLRNFKLTLDYSFEFEDGELTLDSEFDAAAVVSAQV